MFTLSLSKEDQAQLRRQWFWSNAAIGLTFAFCALAGRFYFGFSFRDMKRFRREVWKKLDEHDGPVIWAANHLTLIDSFLIFWAVFPFTKLRRARNLPWSTPEYTNYYRFGGFFQRPAVYLLMYLCRCIPFLRGGEDEAAVRFRETAFEKCVWILKEGGTVFVFPEAKRARNGWFDKSQPKEFLADLWRRVPKARVLTIYLRGEDQLHSTAFPKHGETFRAYAQWYDPKPEASAREISAGMFDKIAELQEKWFAGSPHPRNCSGNDIIDLKDPLRREHFDEDGEIDPDWAQRHLTETEQDYLADQRRESLFKTFWKFIAAKEACHKALAQSGIVIHSGGYRTLEIDIFRRKAVHRPSKCSLELSFTDEDEDKVHCLAVLRGGGLETEEGGDVLWRVDEVPPGERPGDYARRRCLEFIAESDDDIPSPHALAFTEEAGVPKILRRGKVCDWGVSLSHSGRFVAYSFMVS